MVNEFDVEILVGVETMAGDGRLLGTPNLDDVVLKSVEGRTVPVLPLPTMLALLPVTGDHDRAAMVLLRSEHWKATDHGRNRVQMASSSTGGDLREQSRRTPRT